MNQIPLPLKSKQPTIPFGKLQGACMYIVAFNLLWPYFADSALSVLFPLACFFLFGMMWLNIFINASISIKTNSLLCYAGLIVWSFLMIYVYGFVYSPHSKVDFLMFSMDSYAIFFIRIFISILPAMVYVDYKELTINKVAKASIFLVLLVTVALTSKAVAFNPDALRARAMMEIEGLESLLKGTPAYAMTYSYALLFPVFLHKCRMTSGITRTFYIICSVMLGYIVMVAQYATALLIMLIGAIVYVFLISKQRTRVGLVLCVIGFGCILAITNGGADIIRAIARNVEGAWAIKLEDIALTLSGKGGADSVTARSALYAESVYAFIQSPLFGKLWGKTGRIGGHATAIDVLGLTGMAGFIVMIACICGNFSRMKTTHLTKLLNLR